MILEHQDLLDLLDLQVSKDHRDLVASRDHREQPEQLERLAMSAALVLRDQLVLPVDLVALE